MPAHQARRGRPPRPRGYLPNIARAVERFQRAAADLEGDRSREGRATRQQLLYVSDELLGISPSVQHLMHWRDAGSDPATPPQRDARSAARQYRLGVVWLRRALNEDPEARSRRTVQWVMHRVLELPEGNPWVVPEHKQPKARPARSSRPPATR